MLHSHPITFFPNIYVLQMFSFSHPPPTTGPFYLYTSDNEHGPLLKILDDWRLQGIIEERNSV